MMVIESGEKPSRMLTWKPIVFISHIRPRSHEDRFPIPLWDSRWETWFCQSLGVPIPVLLENPQCPCRQFNFDPYGDHIQTFLTRLTQSLLFYFIMNQENER